MKRGTWWPIGVSLILATTVGANIWVARIANDDPSFAIEDNYYQKAIDYDSTLAQERENVRLGWHLRPSLGPLATPGGPRLTATLTDSAGAPISGATVHVSALQIARASQVHEATLAAAAVPGEYGATLDARRPGQWELRFDVHAAGTHFTDVVRVDAR